MARVSLPVLFMNCAGLDGGLRRSHRVQLSFDTFAEAVEQVVLVESRPVHACTVAEHRLSGTAYGRDRNPNLLRRDRRRFRAKPG